MYVVLGVWISLEQIVKRDCSGDPVASCSIGTSNSQTRNPAMVSFLLAAQTIVHLLQPPQHSEINLAQHIILIVVSAQYCHV